MRLSGKARVGVAAAVLLGVAAAAWLGRGSLLSWYYLRGLDNAGEGDRELWAGRAAGLGEAAVPGLLDRLGRDDPRACANAGAALREVARHSGADGLSRRLAEGFAGFSTPGRREALQAGTAWLRAEGAAPSGEAARSLARLLPEAARSEDAGVRGDALDLAAALLERPDAAELLGPCRDLALACLTDAEADNRERAAQLALYPGMDLHRQALPLLNDPSPEVRRLAVLILGPATDTIVTEELLRWLHDPDAEVRRLCEMALRGRKLSESHIRLGRLLTDRQPRVRLEVIDHLHRASDLDAGVWLRHLSHDPAPSVRAAAMRASIWEYPQVAFSDRLEEMRADPSPTVGQLAQHFLTHKKRQEAAQPQP
jgi:hypothetical protein